ncbi:hypothetical protein [Flavobacterium lindanitolerans]|uniref:hypothetical protein n=1 Tax=Flavobacterium lindanitolerans TaxID=428988 RepID=UPI0027BA9348|nr:hypothetical protein [Flavobacterium lindanitolerans]
MRKPNVMTEENIEKAYIIMAKIVRDYGDKYMPIFQRMHEIREAHKSKLDLKNIALQIARNSLE